MNERVWYYLVNGRQFGPISTAEMLQEIRRGRANWQSHIWKNGMAEWLPVESIAEFQQQRANTPLEALNLDAQIWYYKTDRENFGPLTARQIRNHITEGSIPKDTMVWEESMEEWSPANALPEFQGLEVTKRGMTRPPMAPHLRKVKPGGKKEGGDWIDSIICALSIEGFATIFGAVVIGGLWLLNLPHKHLISFYILITYGGIIGILSLFGRIARMAGHRDYGAYVRRAVCGLIFVGSLYYLFNHTNFKSSPDRDKLMELKAEWFPNS